MRPGFFLALVAPVGGALGGCSLFVSLDGYEGDASTDVQQASSQDAPADAPTDGTVVDASADGAVVDVRADTPDALIPDTGESGGGCGPDGTACGDGGTCVGGKCGSCTTTTYLPPQAVSSATLGSSACWFCFGPTSTTCCTPSQLLSGVKSDDGTQVRTDLSTGSMLTSQSIDATGFVSTGQIPAGALIQGVEVKIYKWESGTCSVIDSTVQLIKGGNPLGANQPVTSSCWPGSVDFVSYGGPAFSWGVTGGLTDTEVTDPTFGVRLVAKDNISSSTSAYVESIGMAVTYCH